MLPCKPDDDFEAMEVDQLRELYAKCLADFSSNLLSMARIYDALRKKGEDVSDFELIMPAGDLRAIAEHVMLPETFLTLGARPAIKRIVAAMAPSEQKRLVIDHEPIAVAERAEDGSITHRMYAVEKLPYELIKQVFDYRRVRTLAEQSILPKEPINKPVQTADFESLYAEAYRLLGMTRTGDKRHRKKAVNDARDVLERLALLLK